MPLCKVEPIGKQSSWALWQIEETIEELWQQLNPTAEAQFEYQHIHHHQKKLEWLASRLIIKHLVKSQGDSFFGIYKDAFGKPHLHKLPFHISIAHCFPLAVGAIHQTHSIGIDIERPRKKLLRIRDRFLNQQEAAAAGTDLHTLCKFWTSKEVLYKIYGRKKLIFREHIEVLENIDHPGQLVGNIDYKGFRESYFILIDQFDGHFIAYNF